MGVELTIVGLLFWISAIVLRHRSVHNNSFIGRPARIFHIVLAHASALPMILAARSLLAGRGLGLYWLVAGMLICFISALLDAWVLLIEIQR